MSLSDGNGLMGPDGMNLDQHGVPHESFYSHIPVATNMPGNMMGGMSQGPLQPGFAGSTPGPNSKLSPPVPQTSRMQQPMRRPLPQDMVNAHYTRGPPGSQPPQPPQPQPPQSAQPPPQQQQQQQQWDMARQRANAGAGPGPMGPATGTRNGEVYKAKVTGRAQIILDINTELLRQAVSNPKQSQIYAECMKRVQANISHLYALNDSRNSANMPVSPPILTAPPGIPSLQNMYAHLEATFN
ncbi:hypothetical protein B9G98_00015 [Wickerhamiella sorbophila]|uniref:Uncharacterized protein n=1 Tax=Wickerhamiella sorbophila TaxID=45607 RepID=A0A2T0FBQ9_9ASCO|nr:hypothetical protein B9G98_00015 [Wickerhamiella sorbophila]PRT52395.1 hypothetical protein B9G98_00015 [Wickerhamiella sorbophila]